MPIWIRATGPASNPQIELWTQARFHAGQITPTGDRVLFQFQPQGKTNWTNETNFLTPNPDGFLDVKLPENAYGVPGAWRAVWVGTSSFFLSRDVSFPS
jgi:hypothetical protein